MDEFLANLDRADAALAMNEGRVPEARRLIEGLIRELAEPRSVSLRYVLCQCLLDRAFLNGAPGLWKRRLDDLVRCEEQARKLPNHLRRVILNAALIRRANLLASPATPAYDPRKVVELAREIRKLGVDPGQAARLLCQLRTGERRWRRMAALAEEDIRWAIGRNMPQMVASGRLTACRAYIELGEFAEAEDRLAPALEFFDRLGPEESAAQAYRLRAILLAERGESERAWVMICRATDGVENLLRQTGSLFNEQAFLQDKAALYGEALAIALKTGGRRGIVRAWSVAERSKSYFLALILANSDASLFRGVDAGDLARLRELDGQLDHFERLSKTPGRPGEAAETPEAIRGRLESLSAGRRELFDAMMRDNPRWASMQRPPDLDLEAELDRLGRGWGVVSYFWEPRRSGATLHCFFMGRDREPRHAAVDWSQEDLRRIDAHGQALQGAVRRDTTILPGDLARKVLPDELLEAFPPGGESGDAEPELCLLVSPHGRLQGFPIHTLPAGEELLIHRLPVQYIPSLALLSFHRQGVEHPPGEAPGSVLLVGCEQDGFGDVPLAEIPSEIDDLGRIWEAARSGRVVSRHFAPDGTLGSEEIPLDTWCGHEYLHIACHGSFADEQPLDASLRLGSESVRMSQFFSAALRARLISLSACAVGRHSRRLDEVELAGGEWIGFHLPLFYAGARTVLASLWDANSKVAALFMVAFHAALAAGESPARAFRRAACSVSRKQAPTWANWCIAGFPD